MLFSIGQAKVQFIVVASGIHSQHLVATGQSHRQLAGGSELTQHHIQRGIGEGIEAHSKSVHIELLDRTLC